MKTIGLIGGMSWESTVTYYQVINETIKQKLGVRMKLIGPVFEDEGMHVFEWWGGEYRPLEELIAEMAEVKKNNK